MMLTRCPACDTAFRITPAQLRARAGKVRCGRCNTVFDALASLQDIAPAGEAPTAPPPKDAAETAVATPATTVQADMAGRGADAAAVALLREDIAPPAAPPPTGRRASGYAWGAASLLALLVLLGQTIYVFRAELALAHPAWRPQLDEFCRLFECDIPLPRKSDLLSIEASDLHADPQRKNLLLLSATLKNRATFVQAYPYLELTLTDLHDQPMIRKVFEPAQYLAEGADVRAGFAANAELAVNLRLDAGNTDASGYRLYLFYP
jgi:predicted Zn finger-like uncharacterized protein